MKRAEELLDELPQDSDLSWREMCRLESLVKQFAEAKRAKDYAKSDRVRESLSLWQRGTGDEQWLAMAESGRYVFAGFLEDVQHRRIRLLSRHVYGGHIEKGSA